MYKYVACDIDGTLLNSAGELTDNTRAAIAQTLEKGCIFALSSGRPIQGIDKFISELHLRGPMITYNGAMIVDAESRKVLFSQSLDNADSRSVWDLGTALDVTMCVWADNKLYANKDNEKAEVYRRISGTSIGFVKNIEDIPSEITKILWYDEAENMPFLLEQCRKIVPPSVTFCTSRPYFLEFFSNKVSKASALQFVCDYCGITPENILAIGDGMNDMQMIKFAGTGVVLANGASELKQCADFIAPSNDEDGVAAALRKFII